MATETTARMPSGDAPLRIAEMRVYPIAVPDPPLRSSYGLHAPYGLRTIIEIESKEGAIGIAETHGGESTAQALRAYGKDLAGVDAYRLLGFMAAQNDTDSQSTAGACLDRSQNYLVPGENPADLKARLNSAIEIACLDLIGKTLGRPVCDLLGRVRDEVCFSAYAFYKLAGGGGEGADAQPDEYGEALTPEALVKQVRQMVSDYGFQDVKLKAGVLDPEIEIETIRQLRRTFGPHIPLRLDPNCAWSIETSVRVGKSLESELADGGYLEDPTVGLAGMAEVRRKLLDAGLNILFASNVAVTSFADLPETVRADAVQIVLCDPHYWGGIRQVQHLGKICETFGLGLSMHSNTHLGVSLMAMAHAAACTPSLTYVCDTHYPWQTSSEIVKGGRIKFDRGRIRIPDKPGLGVELDYDQLAVARERYTRCGYQKRDDSAEMRRCVDPNWQRNLPRW